MLQNSESEQVKLDLETLEKLKLERLEEGRQLYESFLAELEGLAVQALLTGNWNEVYAHIATVAGSRNNQYSPSQEDGEAIALITRILGE